MVFLDDLVALFFLCLCFGLFIILSSKKNINIIFGYLVIVLSSSVLLSISKLSAENLILAVFGLLLIFIMFAFQFKDQLMILIDTEESRSEDNG